MSQNTSPVTVLLLLFFISGLRAQDSAITASLQSLPPTQTSRTVVTTQLAAMASGSPGQNKPVPAPPTPTQLPKPDKNNPPQPVVKIAVTEDMVSPQEIGKALNRMRQNPQSLAPYVEAQFRKFIDDKKIQLKQDFFYSTQEGKKAWTEALDFLKKQKPVPKLILHQGLMLAACAHALDLVVVGTISHTGTDGSTMDQRISRYNVYDYGEVGEDIAQGFIYEGLDLPQQAMAQFIVDDGVADRGHRSSLFNEKFLYYGSASRRSGDNIITVIEMSSENLNLTGVVPPGCKLRTPPTTPLPPLPVIVEKAQSISTSSTTLPSNKVATIVSPRVPSPPPSLPPSANTPANPPVSPPVNPPAQIILTPSSAAPPKPPSSLPSAPPKQEGQREVAPPNLNRDMPRRYYTPFDGVDSARYRKTLTSSKPEVVEPIPRINLQGQESSLPKLG